MWEKANRTPVQRKIDSRLLHARLMVQDREVAPGVIYDRLPVEFEALDAPAERSAEYPATAGAHVGERVLVDIRADVAPETLARIEELGGAVVNSVAKYRAIRAWLPLDAMDGVATFDAVQWIRVADRAVTNREVLRPGLNSGAASTEKDEGRYVRG